MSHNLGPRYARKLIKGSEDSDDNLVSKKIESKMANWVGTQGHVTDFWQERTCTWVSTESVKEVKDHCLASWASVCLSH